MTVFDQIAEELRTLAGDGSMEWTSGPIRTETLSDAATAIEYLAGALRKACDENDQLRKAVAYWQRMYEEQIGVRR